VGKKPIGSPLFFPLSPSADAPPCPPPQPPSFPLPAAAVVLEPAAGSFMQLCGQIDNMNADKQLHPINEEGAMEKSNVNSRTSPLNGNTADADKFKDRTSIEDFEIIKPISRGTFGLVFLARKRVNGDLFAIKVLKKSYMIRKNTVESILAERDILISVRNPFVVRFFYSFTCRENLYLVMEYLNGGDLYSLLRNLGCIDEDMARTYIVELVCVVLLQCLKASMMDGFVF
jgi:serine/threonine protein kinase